MVVNSSLTDAMELGVALVCELSGFTLLLTHYVLCNLNPQILWSVD